MIDIINTPDIRSESFAMRALLVTDNLVEAADLTDALERRGVVPVRHLRAPSEARRLLEDGLRPDLVILGVSLLNPDALSCLALATACGARQIVVSGDMVSVGLAELMLRPFTNQNLDAALARLGF